MNSTINILGLGVRGKKQLTLESLSIMRNSDMILYFPMEVNFESWLKESVCIKKAESLAPLYIEGAIDIENYKRIVNRIIEVSESQKNIAILVPGHPYLGVTWVKMLKRVAIEKNINVNFHEGISSFDTMMNDLQVDPLDRGAVILDANRLLLYSLNIEPRMDLFIYHVCSVGNSNTDYDHVKENNNLNVLQKYLMKFYTEDHKVVLIGSNSKLSNSLTKEVKLKDLDLLDDYITVATSLYIPGVETEKKDINNEFYNLFKIH
ncbi:SAM-dependent methyltransferase [Lysinibacillus xylanilyticus]|uniref:SAM-dependent methyltransferase n=1 Tax=Lysinibacillus xylanilyticus TaxID=582475 RepID=UPI003D058AB2